MIGCITNRVQLLTHTRRAGRDGEESSCALFWSRADLTMVDFYTRSMSQEGKARFMEQRAQVYLA